MSKICLLPSPSYSRGQACKAQSQHKHFMKTRFSKSMCNTVAAEGPSSCEGFLPKNCCPPHSSLYIRNIHHPHLLRPLHHLHLPHHLLHRLLYIYTIIIFFFILIIIVIIVLIIISIIVIIIIIIYYYYYYYYYYYFYIYIYITYIF